MAQADLLGIVQRVHDEIHLGRRAATGLLLRHGFRPAPPVQGGKGRKSFFLTAKTKITLQDIIPHPTKYGVHRQEEEGVLPGLYLKQAQGLWTNIHAK